MACLRRDMLLASVLAMLLLLRSEMMSLRFADTSAKERMNQHTRKSSQIVWQRERGEEGDEEEEEEEEKKM